MTPPLVLKNARLIDPETGRDETGDVLLRDGLIAEIGTVGAPDGAETIDCQGHVLAPGLIDMRVFVGEPGMEYQEDFATASHAAAAGGVTTICIQPNTDPVIDTVPMVDFVRRRARDTASVNIIPMAALTKGTKGQEMTEIGMLGEAGAIAFSDGDQAVASSLIMRRIMDYSCAFDALVVHHNQDPSFKGSGVVNESEVATRLGLPGLPSVAETIMLERDIRLVELTGCRYHAGQVSCLDAVDEIRQAKRKGLKVSCAVSVHHFALNENDVGPYRTFLKTDPPLRSEEDRNAMVAALADGAIDVIVSSHDPQDQESKRRPFEEARHGCVGLETMLPLTLELVHNEHISLKDALAKLTINPAKLLGLSAGRLQIGAPADLTLIDLNKSWALNRDELRSRSRNTPFEGRRLQGRSLKTFVRGAVVFDLDRD